MSTIAKMENAVRGELISKAIVEGSFADLCKLATALYSYPVNEVDDSPASYQPTVYAADSVATIKPGKAA